MSITISPKGCLPFLMKFAHFWVFPFQLPAGVSEAKKRDLSHYRKKTSNFYV